MPKAILEILIPIKRMGKIKGRPSIEIKTPELFSSLAIAEEKENTIDKPKDTKATFPKNIW